MGQAGWRSIYGTGRRRAGHGYGWCGPQMVNGWRVARSCPLKVNRNKLCWVFGVRPSGSLPREEAWASS